MSAKPAIFHDKKIGDCQLFFVRPQLGFTLLEALITLVILVTLMGLTLPALQDSQRRRNRSICQANLKNLHRAIHIQISENPKNPSFTTDLTNATFLRNYAGASLEMMRCPSAPDGELGYAVNSNIHVGGNVKESGEIPGINIAIYEIPGGGNTSVHYRHNGITQAVTYFGDIRTFPEPDLNLNYIPPS